MRPSSRFRVSAFLLVLGIALPALAFEYPLSSTSVRDAYFIGKRTPSRNADFFSNYTHFLPAPKTGPYVQAISLETPFVQVAERSGSAFNYYAQDAEEEFTDKELPFRVNVTIDLNGAPPPQSSSNPRLAAEPIPDFLGDYDIQLLQDKPISSISKHLYLLYSDASADPYGLSGAVIEVDYDPEALASTDTTIKVGTPDGQHVRTTFDLAQLR
jgi:hypothetical protein